MPVSDEAMEERELIYFILLKVCFKYIYIPHDFENYDDDDNDLVKYKALRDVFVF